MTENRGVPSSSLGLAIRQGPACRRGRCVLERLRATPLARQLPQGSVHQPHGPCASPCTMPRISRRRGSLTGQITREPLEQTVCIDRRSTGSREEVPTWNARSRCSRWTPRGAQAVPHRQHPPASGAVSTCARTRAHRTRRDPGRVLAGRGTGTARDSTGDLVGTLCARGPTLEPQTVIRARRDPIREDVAARCLSARRQGDQRG